jgi:hypothetical protein
MLSYKNIPKSRLFNNMKFKNAFGINNKKENNKSFKNIQNNNNKEDNYKLKKSNTNLSLNMNKKEDMIDYMNKSTSDEYISENYEELFLYFLFESEKIEMFDDQNEFRNEKRINKKFTFFYIFQSFGSEDKMRLNNFLFPKSIYKLLYLKSRKLQKQIVKYSITSGIKMEDLLNSYNIKYTSQKNVKNWCLKPKEAYKNYEEISLREKLEKDKLNNNGNPYLKDKNYTDFIIKTDNNGKGKTLLFLGKSFHLYIDDYDNYHKVQEHNGISMAVEESEFNKNTKNQIIYTVDELILKNKNNQHKNSNNFDLDIPKAKQNYQNKSKNKKLKSFKSNLNLNLKNKNSKKYLSLDSKRKNKTKIFDNQEEDKNDNSKLPLIPKLKKPVINGKLPKENHNSKTKTNKVFYKNMFVPDNKNKGNKKLTSFNMHQEDKIPHSNKKIINFFRKENSDFYY